MNQITVMLAFGIQVLLLSAHARRLKANAYARVIFLNILNLTSWVSIFPLALLPKNALLILSIMPKPRRLPGPI
jgi:hypothetical protein